MLRNIITATFILTLVTEGYSLMCYKCAPSMPGCNDPFNWRGMGYLGSYCPEENDKCVKLIERKGADIVVTRDCLSNLEVVRTDVPADRYEGCKHSSTDIRLAQYVNNSIKEYDVKRNYYDETTWCICYLDHRCNSSSAKSGSIITIVFAVVIMIFYRLF